MWEEVKRQQILNHPQSCVVTPHAAHGLCGPEESLTGNQMPLEPLCCRFRLQWIHKYKTICSMAQVNVLINRLMKCALCSLVSFYGGEVFGLIYSLWTSFACKSEWLLWTLLPCGLVLGGKSSTCERLDKSISATSDHILARERWGRAARTRRERLCSLATDSFIFSRRSLSVCGRVIEGTRD